MIKANSRLGHEYKNKNIYDSLYFALINISNKSQAISKSEFSDTKAVRDVGIINGLISEAGNNIVDTTSMKKHRTTKYYKITQKGVKYIEMYENLNNIISY